MLGTLLGLKKMPTYVRQLAIAASLSMPSFSYAFELAFGLQNGMSLNTVSQLLEKQGYSLTGPIPGYSGSSMFFARKEEHQRQLNFCNGRLYGVAWEQLGDANQFLHVVEKYDQQFGKGKRKIENITNVKFPDGTLLPAMYTVTYVWNVTGGYIYLSQVSTDKGATEYQLSRLAKNECFTPELLKKHFNGYRAY